MDKNGVPSSAMVIVAHPDDAEFSTAGTVATWTKAGCRVIYVLSTDGNVGTHVPDMTCERLAEIRRAEQRAACAILGVNEIVFLGHDDGKLEPTLEFRRELVGVIRQYKPEVVIAGDPTMLFAGDGYINHPDHRAVAQATLDAISPSITVPLLWPEMGAAHRVRKLYVHGGTPTNLWVDISETIDLKIAALKQHASQLGDWDPTEMIKQWAAETGKEKQMAHAESYRVFTLVREEDEN